GRIIYLYFMEKKKLLLKMFLLAFSFHIWKKKRVINACFSRKSSNWAAFIQHHNGKGGIIMRTWKLKIRMLWYKFLMKLGMKSEEIYYIGGSEALPPPLTKEEEKELLVLLPKGDKSARAILIERNLRLVVYIARKFENKGIN